MLGSKSVFPTSQPAIAQHKQKRGASQKTAVAWFFSHIASFFSTPHLYQRTILQFNRTSNRATASRRPWIRGATPGRKTKSRNRRRCRRRRTGTPAGCGCTRVRSSPAATGDRPESCGSRPAVQWESTAAAPRRRGTRDCRADGSVVLLFVAGACW